MDTVLPAVFFPLLQSRWGNWGKRKLSKLPVVHICAVKKRAKCSRDVFPSLLLPSPSPSLFSSFPSPPPSLCFILFFLQVIYQDTCKCMYHFINETSKHTVFLFISHNFFLFDLLLIILFHWWNHSLKSQWLFIVCFHIVIIPYLLLSFLSFNRCPSTFPES